MCLSVPCNMEYLDGLEKTVKAIWMGDRSSSSFSIVNPLIQTSLGGGE